MKIMEKEIGFTAKGLYDLIDANKIMSEAQIDLIFGTKTIGDYSPVHNMLEEMVKKGQILKLASMTQGKILPDLAHNQRYYIANAFE
jgi:hypothetical protein